MADMFAARDQLVSSVIGIKPNGGEAGIATGAQPDTLAAPAVFIYRPGPNKGKVQITAQYSKEDTIRRINKLNVSKYLTGTKVAEGEDAPRISGRVSQALITADVQGTTSFSRADALLHGLRNASLAIPRTVGVGDRLTQSQVGIIKLMVLNDALATTMVRYQDLVGQAQHKDIQRFFPKSRRDEYVKALAKADLDAAEMAALKAEIDRTTAADAQLLYDNADPAALRTDEAFKELGAADPSVPGMIDAKRRLVDPNLGPPNAADVVNLKDAVLGANGDRLAARMSDAAWAYTDLTVNAAEHVVHDPTKPVPDADDIALYGAGNGGNIGAVIETPRGYTPVAGRGAIYEMREREAKIDKSGWLNIGSLDEVTTAIDLIFGAVE